MKSISISRLAITLLLLGFGFQARALVITPDDAQYSGTGDPTACNYDTIGNGTKNILNCLTANVTDFDGSDKQYKYETDDGSEEGILASSYLTSCNSSDPDTCTVTYVGGADGLVLSGDPMWMFVKDGKNPDYWYLIDLSAAGWDGTEQLVLQCFWGVWYEGEGCGESGGAISHFAFFGDTEVPEPGSLALLGTALIAMGLVRRRRKIAA